MEIVVDDRAPQRAAEVIALRVLRNPRLILGLATGRTMQPVYAELITLFIRGEVSFRDVRTVNLDEYVGLGVEHAGSFAREMSERFFRHVDIDPANTHLPNGAAADADTEADRFEHLISRLGGIDLQLLGIGRSGHIGFNEPPSALHSRTRVVTLTPTTRRQNAAAFGGDPARVPERAITMGVATIMDSRELLVVATGAAKADVVAAAVEGPVTTMVSASAVQGHPRCLLIVDEAAARGLNRRRS